MRLQDAIWVNLIATRCQRRALASSRRPRGLRRSGPPSPAVWLGKSGCLAWFDLLSLKSRGSFSKDIPARSATTPPLTLPKCLNPLLFAPPSGIDVALYFYGYVVVLSSASVAVDYVIHCYFHRFYNPRLDRLRLVYRARVADSVMQRKPRARPGKLVAVLIQA